MDRDAHHRRRQSSTTAQACSALPVGGLHRIGPLQGESQRQTPTELSLRRSLAPALGRFMSSSSPRKAIHYSSKQSEFVSSVGQRPHHRRHRPFRYEYIATAFSRMHLDNVATVTVNATNSSPAASNVIRLQDLWFPVLITRLRSYARILLAALCSKLYKQMHTGVLG